MITVYVDYEKRLTKWRIRRITKKLYKISRKEEIILALSRILKENELFNNEINKYGLRVLDGRWLFKFLLIDILSYIAKMNDCRLRDETIAILIQNCDEVILQQIDDIAKNVKVLKIITEKKENFSFVERELYNNYGIAIQITNNKEKSLGNVDIVINFDFNEDKLKEYKINENAVIVNISQTVNLSKNEFNGKCLNRYEICYNEGNYEDYEIKGDFEKNVLYESYIYRRDNFANIQKQMKNDGVRLVKLA